MPLSESLAFQNLDCDLAAAATNAWPLWKTIGGGGDVPQSTVHDFKYDTCKGGARVDFYRGRASHDQWNGTWSQWLQRLPRYHDTLQQDVRSTNMRGNAMEMAAGVAYAASKGADWKGPGHLDWSRDGEVDPVTSKLYWECVWPRFLAVGLGPTEYKEWGVIVLSITKL